MEVVAHRGSSLRYPENTLEAFEAALAEGATGIETDLRLTRDGAIVLLHDPDLTRLAGDPRSVASLSLGEIRRVTGRSVALLEELWELAAGRVRLNLEVKDPAVTPALLRFLRGRAHGFWVTSFHVGTVDAIRAELPGVVGGPVLHRLGPVRRRRLTGRGYGAVSLAAEGYSDAALAFCRREGTALLLWVVNDPDRVLHFRRLGVDGVFTDDPLAATVALGRSREGEFV